MELLASAEKIIVAKGKSVVTYEPNVDNQEEILKAVLGRSGSLRAPTVKMGNVFFVGYNESLYSNAPFLEN